MNVDVETVLLALQLFERVTNYWFEEIGLETPSEFTDGVEKMKEFLRELSINDEQE